MYVVCSETVNSKYQLYVLQLKLYNPLYRISFAQLNNHKCKNQKEMLTKYVHIHFKQSMFLNKYNIFGCNQNIRLFFKLFQETLSYIAGVLVSLLLVGYQGSISPTFISSENIVTPSEYIGNYVKCVYFSHLPYME